MFKQIGWVSPVLLAAVVGCGKAPVAESTGPTTPSNQAVVARENTSHANTPAEDRDSFQPGGPIVNSPAKELPVRPDSPPDFVVKEFLNALKSGDDGVTAGLLTAVAREETAKHNLAVQPPGTPTAQYEVTAAEIDAQDPTLAQVACLWSEKDDQGGQRSDEVIWVLKKESQGWRVCGMATRVPTRPEPVLFNFENPAEMMAISDEVALEMEKIAQQPVGSAAPSEEAAALEAKATKGGNKLRN